MDAYLTIRIHLTRNITINLPRLNSMLQAILEVLGAALTQKYVNYYRQMHESKT
jgi:hypothetical protein